MKFETNRLILRPWQESDAEALFKYAKHPDVGPIAGWPAHTSVENSREIIKIVLSALHTFAVVLKETGEPVDSIGLKLDKACKFCIYDAEAEIGYWIGVPCWGQSLITEAVSKIIRYGFEALNFNTIWCACLKETQNQNVYRKNADLNTTTLHMKHRVLLKESCELNTLHAFLKKNGNQSNKPRFVMLKI